ncbi:hypothetical protein CBR_g52335 [Chara braunii]|uniref:Uncharacterized protein n=1 Tax=Chara braunii TaxID=69332 RepID=A0A388K722_CHABU|nr:hypothetical protein CBR_g52335 [Chara braunii]|eukprot:GBG65743.1 hypothetical protein CBR_g52335 [Chara braunii]
MVGKRWRWCGDHREGSGLWRGCGAAAVTGVRHLGSGCGVAGRVRWSYAGLLAGVEGGVGGVGGVRGCQAGVACRERSRSRGVNDQGYGAVLGPAVVVGVVCRGRAVAGVYCRRRGARNAKEQFFRDEGYRCLAATPMMVDSNTRQIGKILRGYDEMIVHCLSVCAAFDEEQDAVLEVFDRHRTMFKSPAYVNATMLDAEFQDHTLPDDDEMQQGLKAALAMSEDAPNDKTHLYGSSVHYLQQVEDELPTDQQLVSGRGARATVTQEELMQARQRMRVPPQRSDEGYFLYESSSSDDEDFFGTGMLASDDDNDLDDRHLDGDDDDGARGDDRGDGADRPQPGSTRRDGDRGSDEAAIDYRDEGDVGAGTGEGRSRYRDGARVDDNDGAGDDGHGVGDGRVGTGAVGSTREDTDKGMTAMDVDHCAASDDHGDEGDDDGP